MDGVYWKQQCFYFAAELSIKVVNQDFDIIRLKQIHVSLFNQFFQKAYSQLFVIYDPTCFYGLNVTRKCEIIIT